MMQNEDAGIRVPGFAVFVKTNGEIELVFPNGASKTIPPKSDTKSAITVTEDDAIEMRTNEEWHDLFRTACANGLHDYLGKL